MKKLLKGYIAPLILIVFCVTIVSITTIVYFQFKQKATHQSIQLESSSSPFISKISKELRTYDNNDLGFYFTYPSNFSINNKFGNTNEIYLYDSMVGEFTVKVQPTKSEEKTIASEAEKYFTPGLGAIALPQNIPNTKLYGNVDAVRSEYKQQGPKYPENVISIFTVHNNKTYLINARFRQDDIEIREAFERMIERFHLANR